MIVCENCGTSILNNKKRKFCSDECSSIYRKEYQKKRKYNYSLVKKWRQEIKIKSVEYKGGKCQICGYDRCLRSLDFHHINPSEKEFSISSMSRRSIVKIKNELDKCILVCSNCHGEIHDNLINVIDIVPIVDNSFSLGKKIEDKICKCGVKIPSYNKTCGECYHKSTRKCERPSLEILLKEVDSNGYTKTGLKFKVSCNTIRKWIKQYKKEISRCTTTSEVK